jgi:hypothetical protein
MIQHKKSHNLSVCDDVLVQTDSAGHLVLNMLKAQTSNKTADGCPASNSSMCDLIGMHFVNVRQ